MPRGGLQRETIYFRTCKYINLLVASKIDSSNFEQIDRYFVLSVVSNDRVLHALKHRWLVIVWEYYLTCEETFTNGVSSISRDLKYHLAALWDCLKSQGSHHVTFKTSVLLSSTRSGNDRKDINYVHLYIQGVRTRNGQVIQASLRTLDIPKAS